MKMKKKARYVSPRILGPSALLRDLFCTSVKFNIHVNPLENMNPTGDPLGIGEDATETFYFES